NEVGETIAERMPLRAIPACDVVRGHTAGRGEVTSRDQFAVVRREAGHEPIHACADAEGIPRAPVPRGNATHGKPTGNRIIPAGNQRAVVYCESLRLMARIWAAGTGETCSEAGPHAAIPLRN